MNSDPFSGENLYYDVIAYTRLGEHRSGTDCDMLTTQWILNRLKDAGLDTSFQPYAFHQFFPTQISLLVSRKNLEAFPEWTPKFTGPEPIRAPLVSEDSSHLNGNIVLLKPPMERSKAATFRTSLRSKVTDLATVGARAVVLITPGPSGEVYISNGEENEEPFALPLLAVGSRDEPLLKMAAERFEEITFLLDGEENVSTESRNVIARWGKQRDIIIISTPTSGWFTCGGERGPGIAIALALARWLGQRRPGVGYLFDFNSGHELTGLGARRFLTQLAPKPPDVRCWIHLGANIATYDYVRNMSSYAPSVNPAKYQLTCSDGSLLPSLNKAFSPMPEVKPFVGPGIGELTAFIREGHRAFGMFGGRHFYFHTPGDGPQTTAPELLEPIARCLTTALGMIEEEK